MNCSIVFGIAPGLARLPRGLVLILILSLIWQIGHASVRHDPPRLPPLSIPMERWVRHPRRSPGPRLRFRFHCGSFLAQRGLRLLAREALLVVLLQASGWLAVTPWSQGVLLLPFLQTVCAVWRWRHPPPWPRPPRNRERAWLQRGYQLTLVLLLLSSGVQLAIRLHNFTAGLFIPVGLGTWVTRPDEDTDIRIATTKANHFTVTLRGTFQFVWTPRDGFEKWMLILFLRGLHRVGASASVLSQTQLAEAFGSSQSYVSRWERLVAEHGWHVLSDRFRHALQSLLPNAELSQAILKVWVPAFWLSAWEVRERLVQLGVLPNREALPVEALHALAQHTGFKMVRDVLLERFDLRRGQLTAREHWWLGQLLALNERLIQKLERGEALTPQELVDIGPLRLQRTEKPVDSEAPPLAASLNSALFDPPPPPPESVPAVSEPVRCTYCHSDEITPKSKQPRLKTIINAFGEKQVVEVLRYYCQNLACPYHTFTHLPAGVLPHSPYPVQVRLLAVQVYVHLLSTYRRSARMLAVKASTVYRWAASVSPAAFGLAAYLGVVRTSGVVGIDDKWILVCSPSAVRPHGRRPRAVWRYIYFAVDAYSYDLLALQVYPEHNAAAVRLFLLELKAKGIGPRVIVTDLDPAYGRMLPLVFPQAVHHECIFHAVQNALNQMTKVYSRYYLEKRPETLPLHEALTHLFQAETQKTVRQRFAALMELRSGYVTRTPEVAMLFDSLERHFPKLINAIESPDIPRTNNATELVIRRFDQHYQSMCGLDSFESAQVYLRLFELVYRLTPFADDGRPAIRGKCPLELAGYDLHQLPIAEFFMNLKLPSPAWQGAEVVPMA